LKTEHKITNKGHYNDILMRFFSEVFVSYWLFGCLKFTPMWKCAFRYIICLIFIVFFYLTKFLCEGIYEKFANALRDAVQNMKVGDGFSEGVSQVVIGLFYLK